MLVIERLWFWAERTRSALSALGEMIAMMSMVIVDIV
jgi:hypothetical protein